MAFHKIFCPVDFSPGSERAMQIAVRLAKESEAELAIANVWYVPPLVTGGGYSFSPTVFQEMMDDAKRELERAAGRASQLGAPRVTSLFLSGPPWDRIIDELRGDPAYDLVVMSTHGRTGLARVLIGSVAERVIRHAPCPVLATRPHGPVEPVRHILCPIDFSDSARHAMQLAAELGRPSGAAISLLYVAEVPVGFSELSLADPVERVDPRAAELLAGWAAELRATAAGPVATRTMVGSPGAQILAALDEDPTFDLVAMGSRGRTGLRRVVLGSVAEKVVRHATCSVLVTRGRDE
ncbi:MAG: universal stress protein [Kofleriaceae bacterium]